MQAPQIRGSGMSRSAFFFTWPCNGHSRCFWLISRETPGHKGGMLLCDRVTKNSTCGTAERRSNLGALDNRSRRQLTTAPAQTGRKIPAFWALPVVVQKVDLTAGAKCRILSRGFDLEGWSNECSQ